MSSSSDSPYKPNYETHVSQSADLELGASVLQVATAEGVRMTLDELARAGA